MTELSRTRDVRVLSFAFMVLFAGFNGVQLQVTTSTRHLGPHVGFVALILIYVVLTLGAPIAGSVISRFGARRSMIGAAPVYALFAVAMASNSVTAIYTASAAPCGGECAEPG